MRLSEATVVIYGLGLMGGSLALALRGKCEALVGVARRAEVREAAVRFGVVDRATDDPLQAASQADIVVLATPVRTIIRSIPEAAAHMRAGALLLDLGSTKRKIVAAMNRIPREVLAVGGHPMCGKERGGLEHAHPMLFTEATFVLTPTTRTTDEALALASEVASAIGARPLVLDAEHHDRAVALISHLPYALAAALVHTASEAGQEDPIINDLAASGFRDTTRLAASEVEMMLDILLTNSEAVRSSLDLFQTKLDTLRDLLDQPFALKEWIVQAQTGRKEIFN